MAFSSVKSLIPVFQKTTASLCNLCKRQFTVCVEGNIGSGKTTFLSHFKKFNNTTVLQEPVDLWRDVGGTNLLKLMYEDPARHAFLFQSYVQLTMLQRHTYKPPLPYKIMERSVHSGRCFIENMKRAKLLSNVEIMVLNDWYEWCTQNTNLEIDLIVYLRTSPTVVYQRMKERARKEENSVSLEYLKQIHDIHDEWLYHQTLFTVPAPVLVLDGNKNLKDMIIEFENCKNQIFNRKISERNT
ncbi:Deoxynucleoside kinase [Habropoda laboriosa]|uniref:Deoxynucleoside kinase n=1 Tax=Habropoda laboriosa TaxID=597456 RepID=A0A0L7QXH2_9HYME|nr:PREDICTED: deoxynucleoside kinase [Habropoda laboriosa]KOC63317.1 Deoxynucleoside kinase [Habropoda laboriosa]